MVQAREILGARRMAWRQELAPVVAVAGLAADYLSPPAAWTMVLPFVFSLLLLWLSRRRLFRSLLHASSSSLFFTPLRGRRGPARRRPGAAGEHRRAAESWDRPPTAP